ncbi:nuclear pore complex protein Nup50-like [Daphnia pulicaria]|uniref:nuclear pore complex protein Nup50-like n=1 Tax=Daphnia pulicaria TaxID=35523 RepID=UPI001EEB2719|nr:nuclear pore complex protein Nup50-like [Daphnia pulicaria]XP_046645235.1 nuclear pore complex protein Nup50-like [Daphnia pulicaria]
MAKRTATRELNHDNWNDEEEEEEAGSFQQASDEALKGRVIRQAKRRIAGNDGEAKKGFSGFAGFGVRTGSEPSKAFSNFAIKVPTTVETGKTENGEKTPTDNGANEKEYLANLKSLNETVTTWITDHVKKNPCCVLTPIFRDYEKHLKDLESKRASPSSKENMTTEPGKIDSEKPEDKKFQFGSASAEAPKPSFSFFGNGSTVSTPAKPPSTFSFASSTPTTAPSISTFSFGAPAKSDQESKTSLSTFSFKASSTSSTTSPPSTGGLFAFSGTKPAATTTTAPAFSFGFSSTKPATEVKKEEAEGDKDGEEGGDEDAPPKVEVKEVKEEDAFYSIRCKLFYKKDANYTEKGVGTMHLKKVKDDKTQLVIRADTSLGNILLNIILNPQITTQRIGKNNVMLVCIPNPPIDPKTPPVPTPMLLRVKTDTEADELLAKLNEAKK